MVLSFKRGEPGNFFKRELRPEFPCLFFHLLAEFEAGNTVRIARKVLDPVSYGGLPPQPIFSMSKVSSLDLEQYMEAVSPAGPPPIIITSRL